MDEQILREEVTVTNVSNAKHRKLAQEIEEMHDNLLTSIRILIWKMGMAASKKEAEDLSHEILNETVITAIEIDERFDPEKSIHAWLMSIATYKIKALGTKENRRSKRMGIVGETYQFAQQKSKSTISGHEESEKITEDEMIDFLVSRNLDENPLRHKVHLKFGELISLVSPDDQILLKFAFVDNLKGKDLAAILKTSVGAATVRLSRVIHRLRLAYLSSEASERSE
jgi:RNA polymerase sigma factor (sigma-70 family)